MKGINTVKLLGGKRIKVFIIGMLLVIPSLLFFFSLVIHMELNDNILLFSLLYLSFGSLFVFAIYLLINLEEKLTIANLFVGLCSLLISLVVYIAFSYIVSKGRIFSIVISIGLFALTCGITEIFLFTKKFFNFKQLGKMSDSFWLYIIGVGIGKGGYEFIKRFYGREASDIVVVGSFLLISTIFGFLGLFYINKYYIVKKYSYWIHVIYEE